MEEPKVPEAPEDAVGSNGAVEPQEVMVLTKFEDPKWINGTWDLKQFQKDGQTNWDAVIDAGEVFCFCLLFISGLCVFYVFYSHFYKVSVRYKLIIGWN